MPEPLVGFEILWVSALAYPNLFGTKGFVVVFVLVVVVSFAPLCKQGYLLHLVAIATFCCTAQNTFSLRVFCVVQPKCHTDNVA